MFHCLNRQKISCKSWQSWHWKESNNVAGCQEKYNPPQKKNALNHLSGWTLKDLQSFKRGWWICPLIALLVTFGSVLSPQR